MKGLTPLQNKRIRQYKSTLNPQSKFYKQDLDNFIEHVKKESPEKSQVQIANHDYMQSEKFQKEIAKEEKRMDKSGMYDIKKMHARNGLD